MLEDLIKDMKGKGLISIPRYRLSADQLPFLEFLGMIYYTRADENDFYWWANRAIIMSEIDGGFQHSLVGYKGGTK